MTDDPTPAPQHGDDEAPGHRPTGVGRPADDVTPAEAQELRTFFGELVADEPAPTVTPLTVLSQARRAGRASSSPSGPTAGRLRIGLIAAALVSVAVTGAVLLVTADPTDTASMTPTSVAAGTTTGGPSGGGAPSGAPASSAAPTTTAAGSMSESGSMAPPLSPTPTSDASGASSAASSAFESSSAASSTAGSASSTPTRCTLTASAALPRVREAVRGTVLAEARFSVCRDPASLSASEQQLVVNITTSPSGSCADARPGCRAVAGSPNTYTDTSAAGFRIWVYGRGYELLVLSASRPTEDQLAAIVAAAREMLPALA